MQASGTLTTRPTSRRSWLRSPKRLTRAWVRERLRALVGLPSSDASREESLAAWTRFLLGIADTRPAVLVFEDLHWADDALLKFLEQLVERMASVPLLVVATARPELFERAPSFAGGWSGRPHRPAPADDRGGRRSRGSTAQRRTSDSSRPDRRTVRRQPVLHRAERAPAGGQFRIVPAGLGPGRHRRPPRPPAACSEGPYSARRLDLGSLFWSGALAAIGRR